MVIQTAGRTTYNLIFDDPIGTVAQKYKWYCTRKGKDYYFYTILNGKHCNLNQLLFNLELYTVVLHKNSDPFDYRFENLVTMSRKEFGSSFISQSMNGKSTFRNVQWCNTSKRWHVHITNNGAVVINRFFTDEKDAALVADFIQFKIYGRLLNPNFPDLTIDELELFYSRIMSKYGHTKTEIKMIYQQGVKSKNPNRTSNFIGVSYDNRGSKWYARIKQKQKQYWLGYHLTEEAAAQAYNKKALELYGQNAKLNDLKI